MPYVVPVPQGQNASMIKGLDERARSVEARRDAYGIASGGASYTFTGSAGIVFPTGWPTLTIYTGTSVWISLGCQGSNSATFPPAEIGVAIDGSMSYVYDPVTASSTAVTADPPSASGGSGGFGYGGVPGLTPGFHTFALCAIDNQSSMAGAVATNPWMMIWAL